MGCRTVESGFGRAPHTRQCATRASGCGLNEAFQQFHTASLVPLEGRFLEAKPSAGKSRDPWAICLSTSLKGKASRTAVSLRISLRRLGARGDRRGGGGGSEGPLSNGEERKKLKGCERKPCLSEEPALIRREKGKAKPVPRVPEHQKLNNKPNNNNYNDYNYITLNNDQIINTRGPPTLSKLTTAFSKFKHSNLGGGLNFTSTT